MRKARDATLDMPRLILPSIESACAVVISRNKEQVSLASGSTSSKLLELDAIQHLLGAAGSGGPVPAHWTIMYSSEIKWAVRRQNIWRRSTT